MAKLFDEKPDWTFGIELEVNYKVKAKSSFTFLTIFDDHNNKVIEVSGDMGHENNDQRTVEISTFPIRISQETQRKDNEQLIGLLMQLFNKITQADNNTMTRNEIMCEYTRLVNSAGSALSSRYILNGLLKELTIIHDDISTPLPQISFGLPVTDIDYFLSNMYTSWYQTGKFVLENASDEQQLKYNYTLCLMERMIEIFTLFERNDIISAGAKNRWGIMPRNPVSELWGEGLQKAIPFEKVFDLFHGKYNDEKINDTYRYLIGGGAAGGKLSSIVRLENQIVFEVRCFSSNLIDYFPVIESK